MAWGGAWGAKKAAPGWGGQQWGKPQFDAGIPGLSEALHESFAPIAPQEPDLNKLIHQMVTKTVKAATKWAADPRLSTKHNSIASADTLAKALIEEFVDEIMGTIGAQGVCYGKDWLPSVDFNHPILLTVLHVFKDKNTKILNRTLKPQVIKYISDGLFKHNEEVRVQKAMEEAIKDCGIKEEYQKKALKKLIEAYDEAHFDAPYGSTQNESPELSVLQDFVKGWMKSWVSKSWDALEGGLAEENNLDLQQTAITSLFGTLMNPDMPCMPSTIAGEVTATLGGLPAAPWPFIDEMASMVLREAAIENAPGVKRRRF